jgi:peptide/nickel transport system substrate-binding protein
MPVPRRRLLVAVTAAALSLAACSGGSGSTSAGGGGGSTTPAHGTDAGDANVKAGGEMTFALAEDPDKLDPTFARTLVGREVFANLCEKLYDTDKDLNIVPQLAAELPQFSDDKKTVTIKLRTGITFNDGTPFNADAVKTTLDRDITADGSARKADLAPVSKVEAVDAQTVKLTLSKPYSPLAGALADRAGMIMSPTALKKLGNDFGTAPVCVGPFQFVSRSPGNEIVLKKADNYYDKDKVKLDKLTFKIITDPNVRLANLRSGDIDAAERLAPTDAQQVSSNPDLTLVTATSIGYQGITVNIGNANGIGKPVGTVGTALAKNAKLRQAFDLAIDRDTLNKVVFAGQFAPDCSPLPLKSPFRDDTPCQKADPAKAKQLVQESGVPTPVPATLIIGTDPQAARIGQVLQGMVKAAGFDLKLSPTEFTTALDQTDAGKFDTFAIGWSGRVDPDGNIYNFMHTGAPLNISGISDPTIDDALDQARSTSDVAQRKALYAKALQQQAQLEGLIYLYHEKLLLGTSKKVGGIAYYDDGLPRLKTAGFTA